MAPLPPDPVDPPALVRVDRPDHPDALARSATGAILLSPPTDGTPWRWESVGRIDLAEPDGRPFVPGDAVAVTNAGSWHEAGFRGQGVKVAVLDVGWFGGEVDLGAVGDVRTHDCLVSPSCEPAFDPLASHFDFESGPHGWACAETVRRLAPDAELHLVRAGSLTLLENAVDWAIREGIDVLTLSMSFYDDSFHDGSGPHHELLVRLEEAGVLLVTSAGNDARNHWRGGWIDRNGDGRLDGDGDDGLSVYLPSATTLTVAWNQYGSCGTTDLSARLLDEEGRILAAADAAQGGDPIPEGATCAPTERLRPLLREPGWTRVAIHHERGPTVGLEVVVFAGSGRFLEPMASGAVVDPQADPLAVAVGAVRAADYLAGEVEPFSSWGPNSVGDARPDLVGPDGLDTTVFGAGGFVGTSAASPVIAGLVAVVMSREPELSSREAFDRLQGWAIDDGAPSFAPADDLGAGRARLPVVDAERGGCGRRPLWMMLPPMVWFPWRRRWTR